LDVTRTGLIVACVVDILIYWITAHFRSGAAESVLVRLATRHPTLL